MAREGADMEALSPRDANAKRAVPKAAELKTKTVAQLKSNKEKDHPPPPPPEIPEPPSVDKPDGAVYQVGKMLGKGGFAICYQGYLMPSRHRYALKIVKSHMPHKMQQKVSHSYSPTSLWCGTETDVLFSFKPSCKSTRR